MVVVGSILGVVFEVFGGGVLVGRGGFGEGEGTALGMTLVG